MADPSSQLRVSDRDRDEAARQIREHYAVGRLDDADLNERLEKVYAARTEADLASVRSDLPDLPPTRSQQLDEVRGRRRHLQRRLLQQSGGSLSVFVLCTVIWLATGASGQFWPVWVLIAVVLPLVRNGWRLYGPEPEFDRVEAELNRAEAKHEQRERHAERLSREAERRARQAERDARKAERRARRYR